MAEDPKAKGMPKTRIYHDARMGIHLALETSTQRGYFLVSLQVKCRCCLNWSTPATTMMGTN